MTSEVMTTDVIARSLFFFFLAETAIPLWYHSGPKLHNSNTFSLPLYYIFKSGNLKTAAGAMRT